MSERYGAVLFDLFGTLVDDTATAIAGARERLREVENVPWAIVTSTNASLARQLLTRAALPMPPLLVTADDVRRNKPAPDGYLYAARHLGVEPRDALVVEDSLQGIAAAREAGMDVVAILRGRPPGFANAATLTVADMATLRLRVSEGIVRIEFAGELD